MFACHKCHFYPTGTTLVKHFSPAVNITMAQKRVASKETPESSTGEVIEQTPVDLPVYADTQPFI